MATQSVHKFWLKIAAILVGAFGPVFALATIPGLTEPARWSLDLLSWPLDGNPTYEENGIRFLSALTGGFLIGWAVMIWGLSQWVYDLAPEAVRRIFVMSACSWFVVDSFGSVTSGNWPNVIGNILFLVIAVGPMWWPASDTD